MQGLLYGLIAIALGLSFVFGGLRLFRFLIPIWGFFGGFALGLSVATSLFGSNVFASGIGIVLGLVLAVVFALLSYFFFNLAIIILAATVGYWLGAGVMVAIGFNSGFISVSVGIALAVVAAVAALIGNFAKYFVILATAIGGAMTTISGILLILGKVKVDTLSLTAARTAISNSLLWTILWLGLGLLGILSQLAATRQYEMVTWTNGTIESTATEDK